MYYIIEHIESKEKELLDDVCLKSRNMNQYNIIEKLQLNTDIAFNDLLNSITEYNNDLRKNERLEREKKELLQLQQLNNEIFKNFNIDISKMESGRLKKLLMKKVSYKHKVGLYYKLINEAIEKNEDIPLTYKTIEKHIKYVYDNELNQWV